MVTEGRPVTAGCYSWLVILGLRPFETVFQSIICRLRETEKKEEKG